MDSSYAEVGTEVILGKHKRRTCFGIDWCDGVMDRYVGIKTTIRSVRMLSDGCLVCCVNADDGGVHWRVEDMILASDVPLLTPHQKRQLNIKE